VLEVYRGKKPSPPKRQISEPVNGKLAAPNCGFRESDYTSAALFTGGESRFRTSDHDGFPEIQGSGFSNRADEGRWGLVAFARFEEGNANLFVSERDQGSWTVGS